MTAKSLARGVVVASLLGLLAACGEQKQQQQGGPPPPPVTVANPKAIKVVDKDDYVGRFVAVDSVEVRARVSGQLEKIHFTDGQMVKQGDLLFTIDKRPFKNTYDQALAAREQAQANLAFAQADLTRAQQLVRERTISEQVFEQRTQAKRTAEASVSGAEAQVRQAALDLEFTEVRAAVAGRIGDRQVSAGNLVTGGNGGSTTLLATIVSQDPIRFEFTFDEASYLRYLRLGAGQKDIADRGVKTPIMLRLIDEKEYKHQGTIDFLNNVFDRNSGTIRGRGIFPNAEALFAPGMFARVQVPASNPYEALSVPDAAIGSEQARKFVYVVGEDNVPKPKYVVLGPLQDGARVIKEGLDKNDRVVVNGLMRIRPGQKVTPQEQGSQPPPQGAPGAQPAEKK